MTGPLRVSSSSPGLPDVDAARAHAWTVGPYRLCLELASGGMGTVYLASTAIGRGRRLAAVKVIHPHLASDPSLMEMFLDEAEIAARIQHPNVCAVFDYQIDGEGSYIAMEYLLGESMQSLFAQLEETSDDDPARTSRLVARALADACAGLHAAHELVGDDGAPLEVVHRDVTPANILLTYDGVAKVVDFGVAAAARKRHRTETGILKGKLAYIAPECLAGRRPDRRADVWGLGVVLWELITKERLFRRESDLDTLNAVQDADIPPPSEVRPGIPKELDAIVLAALDRDPDKRTATARELGRALLRYSTSDGEVISQGDLGEWMNGLFPGMARRKRQVVELARRVDEPDEPAIAPVRVAVGPPSETRIEPVPGRPRSRARLFALGAGVLIGAAVTYALSPDSDRPPEAHAQASPELVSPTAARVHPGLRIAHGPYLLEVEEGGGQGLLLRLTTSPGETGATPPPITPLELEVDPDAVPASVPADADGIVAPSTFTARFASDGPMPRRVIRTARRRAGAPPVAQSTPRFAERQP